LAEQQLTQLESALEMAGLKPAETPPLLVSLLNRGALLSCIPFCVRAQDTGRSPPAHQLGAGKKRWRERSTTGTMKCKLGQDFPP